MTPVEDTGPIVDPRTGLRIAVDNDEHDAKMQRRSPSSWLRSRLEDAEAEEEEAEE